jgi:digeranylgeranylglycerophospholipid reductase
MGVWDCVVAGAGPAGGMAALRLATGGLRVLVLEKKRTAGWPIHCGEALSTAALHECGLPPDPAWIMREVKGAKMRLPNGTAILFRLPGVCIRRDRFDQWLASRAQEAGADVRFDTRVDRVTRTRDGWSVETGGGVHEARTLIVATGAVGTISGLSRGRRSRPLLLALQYKFPAAAAPARDWLEFYQGEFFQPGYGWIFDRGGEVNVGIGGQGSLAPRLRSFCAAHGFDGRTRISVQCGYIPDTYTGDRVYRDGVLWVGDAAGLVHPITKGGIHLALHTGKLAGDTIAGALREGYLGRLGEYQDRVGELARSFKKQWRQSRWVAAVPDRVWNAMGSIMDGKHFDGLPFRRLPGFFLTYPWMVPWFLRFHDLQHVYRKTMRFSW